MGRYIDADKLARELAIELEKTKVPRKNEKSNIPYLLNLNKMNYALLLLSVTETEDVVPVVHAHWVEKTFTFECSACCGDAVDNYAYCPRCGAKMDEEE